MSLWRRSNSILPKQKKKGLDGVVMTINEEQRPKSSYKKLQRKTSINIAAAIAMEDVDPTTYDVAIVGAGPAGLMLAANLVRFGISVIVIDDRSETSTTGRADGLQPRTIEILRQMRISDRLLLKGTRTHDMRFWHSSLNSPLQRLKRDIQFPCDQVDTIDPYMLNAHQTFVEEVLLKDMMERGESVTKNHTFIDYQTIPDDPLLRIMCESSDWHARTVFKAKYLVGCDGTHSNVAKSMGSRQVGLNSGEVWGIVDGVIDTNFPDIYSKTVVYSQESGTAVIFPRERNMTRIYVQLKPDSGELASSKVDLTQEYLQDKITEIMEPYTISWKHIDWSGTHRINRKMASKFTDDSSRVFLVGDAAHTASPVAHGMNIAMHDSWNLAWKLNLAVRGLSKPELLDSYEDERRQVADVILDYDCEKLDAITFGDAQIYSENCLRYARIGSGYGADYAPSLINCHPKGHSMLGDLRVGSLPPPAKVTRFIDASPIDLHLDIPMLGQFRMLFFTRALHSSFEFLSALSEYALTGTTVLGRATRAINTSYSNQPPLEAVSDEYVRPERYTTISGICTFGIVVQTPFDELCIEDLPTLWNESRWTVYIDDIPHLDTRGMSCTEKWLGGCSAHEVDIVVIRPDGYIGTMFRARGSKENAVKACHHLDTYFSGFLEV